jgi:uncharacterized protein YjbI with pentapeptide repeats
MASDEHLATLKQGVIAWNTWLHEQGFPWKSEKDFFQPDLVGADLSGADLREANLAGATLSEANLAGATLSEANLAGATLSKANLAGATLSKANVAGAYIVEADLVGADLSEANLAGATLSKTNFAGATLPSGASPSGIRHGFWPLQILRRHQGGGLSLLRRESQTLVDFLAWIGWSAGLRIREGMG